MKTVFIIASIILLSYQIDRFVTRDVALPINKTEKTTLAGILAQDQMADTSIAVRGVKSLKKDGAIASVSNVKKSLVVNQGTKATSKFTLRQTKKVNQFASALHRSIKESGNYVAINSVMFAKNNYVSIQTDEFNTILQYADQLIFDESLKISIAGFADNSGNLEYNNNLSLMRALNVQRYLVELGVSEDRIVISANGVADPVADNDTVDGRALNRRVEMALFHQTLASAGL